MFTMTLDTLKAVEMLQEAGMPAPQAKAVSNMVRETIESSDTVTKADFIEYKSEIKIDFQKLDFSLRHEMGGLRHEMGDLRHEMGDLRHEIGDLRKDMDVKFLGIDTKLISMEGRFDSKQSAMEVRMIKWFVAIALGQFALLAGVLIKLMSLSSL